MSWLNAGINGGIPSRGSYDEDNLDEEEAIERSYHMKISSSKCIESSKILIITTTNLAKTFVDVYVAPQGTDDIEEIGHITEQEKLSEHESKNIEERLVAKLYRISDSVIHCSVEQIPADDLNNFTDVLFSSELLKASENIRIAILSSDHVTNFQSAVDLNTVDVPLKRCLIFSPNENRLTVPCQPLEQPNVIKGVSASVLTECKFKEIPCIVLVSYVDSLSPDSITLSGFMPLFKISEFSYIKKVPNDSSNERLKKLYNKPKKSESIFM